MSTKETKQEQYISLLRNIPVSVNCQLGDPFQDDQWSDTVDKLNSLSDSKHLGPVALITKSIVTEDQIKFLTRSNLDLWIFISITGLNENQESSIDMYRENYLELCRRTNKHVVIFIRPIIEGHNDNFDLLKSIVDISRDGQKKVILRGFKDVVKDEKTSKIDIELFDSVKEYADSVGVKLYEKTLYAVSDVTAWHFIHIPHNRVGIDLLNDLGYSIENTITQTLLSDGNYSKGDINFIRMLSGHHFKDVTVKLESILTPNSFSGQIGCSSSWFEWANRIPCKIDCWYCISKWQSNGLDRMGCNPIDLIKYVK